MNTPRSRKQPSDGHVLGPVCSLVSIGNAVVLPQGFAFLCSLVGCMQVGGVRAPMMQWAPTPAGSGAAAL